VHVENVEVRTVPLFVSVVDRDGVTRDDVDRSLFRILDNETEGKIIEFGKAFDQPISIALLLDASASMQFSIRDAARAASAFAEKTLKQGDRCAVFAIRDVPRREISLSTDRVAIKAALEAMQPQGRTALYDGITSAIRELRSETNRRAIVILTDGSDTSSIASYDEVEKMSQQVGIPIYFIAYETNETSQEMDRLRYLGSQTGGFLVVASSQNLMAKYGEIERDLRAQFAIRYQITDFTKRNQWRKVRVVLNSPKLTARTIRGYYAP
jgi:Ca-activated chloride channel family protein